MTGCWRCSAVAESGESVEPTVRNGVCQFRRDGTRWLSTGPDGGTETADAAYNICVPEGWRERDLQQYVGQRLDEAGFEAPGPALLTGVDLGHTRVGTHGPVVVAATAGLSNPATLTASEDVPAAPTTHDQSEPAGTVNVIAWVDRALPESAQANLLTVVAEAKAATLLTETGFPGTTTDAVVVGCNPAAERVRYTGSGTEVGAAARACVRDAVRASVRSRYAETPVPASSATADHGVVTDIEPTLREPNHE